MIHFDPATHTYSLDGVRYSSVTEIIRAAGMMGDTSHFDDYSADRGTKVHETIRLYHDGKLDPVNVDPVIEPYLDAWIAFLTESKFFPGYIEKILYDPIIKVAGRADMIGPYEGKAAILDIKTGQPNPATAIQLAGYEYLLDSPCRRIAVYLKADGKYSLKEYRDRHDRDTFLGAVAVHNWKKANLK